ncbi:MAG: hypothetical protein IT451_06640 [Candidatus Brocadia sp.]|nr:hypothetical protein [Candidatus Brocadia sp.]
MKDFIVKFLKIFLIIAIIILISLFAFGLTLSLAWPWWIGFIVLLGIVGMCAGGYFLRKILLRQREKKFVQQVIDQNERHLAALKGKEREELKELQDKWKGGVEALKRSHLRKLGNPLYVLPWYLIIGESGTGKTTAINSANLSSSFSEINKTPGISGTRNCDWWFFEQAIILDTAGRWSMPIDEGRDKEEWQRFLSLLVKYRKREPINGVIVSVAANKLLEASSETLEEDGRNIRLRIDELMRVLGFKFPVYVLVTKCDLIQGMTKFCEHLPEKGLDQPMGVINKNLSTDVVAFQEEAIHTIGERLRSLRLLFLHQPASEEINPGILLFPEEFRNLKRGLGAFLKETFRENPYQETAIFRGLFFSSGRQEGRPFSHFLNALGLIGEKEVLPGTSKGLFLHDFFSRILPTDRRLFAPTTQAMEWGKLTRNLGLSSWFIMCLALCGVLSFSFVKNLKIIRDVPMKFLKPTILSGEFIPDAGVMAEFKDSILNIEDQNRTWWIPRFGLNESKKVEGFLKIKYCNQFRDQFFKQFNERMESRIIHSSGNSSYENYGGDIACLVRCINLMRARLEGEGLESLRARPQPFRTASAVTDDKELAPDIRENFSDLYLYHIVWQDMNENANTLNEEMNKLQKWLKHMLTVRKTNFDWLIPWVNTDPSLSIPEVSLGSFWGGTGSASPESVIPRAFTKKGKKEIDAFLVEIETALGDPLIIASQKSAFQTSYQKAYKDSWHDFGNGFSKGIDRLVVFVDGHALPDIQAWKEVAKKIAMQQDPYFSLLERMAEELEPVTKEENLPSWIMSVYSINNTRLHTLSPATGSGTGMISTVVKKGEQLLGKISQKTGLTKNLETQRHIAHALHDYQKALTELTRVSSSREVAFQMAAQVFSEDAATGKSAFWTADNSLASLKAAMGSATSDMHMFWQLISGPLEFLKKYTIRETACNLQKLWEKEVLVELEGTSQQKNINLVLLSQEGYATKFIRGHASPFLDRDPKKGYYARKVLREMIPFEERFLTFTTEGYKTAKSIQTVYDVTIKAIPFDVNPDAKKKPHSTRLEMRCSGSTQSLTNKNYPVQETFRWTPETCGDVILQIDVGENINLIKQYEGAQAFPNYLRDFPGGQHTFTAEDFHDDQRACMERLGIKYIKVKYEFRGHQALLEHFASLQESVPRNIASCWDY